MVMIENYLVGDVTQAARHTRLHSIDLLEEIAIRLCIYCIQHCIMNFVVIPGSVFLTYVRDDGGWIICWRRVALPFRVSLGQAV